VQGDSLRADKLHQPETSRLEAKPFSGLLEFTKRVAFASFLMLPPALAAQQSVDVDISIEKGEAVIITGLDDTVVTVDDPFVPVGAPLVSAFVNPCVHSTTGLYSITISSANGHSNFAVENTAGATMPYRLRLWTIDGSSGFPGTYTRQVHTSTVTLTNRVASPTVSCLGHGFPTNGSQPSNLQFRTHVQRAAFNNAPVGIYTDTLIFTIVPD